MLAVIIIGQMRTYQNINIMNSYKKYLYNGETIDLYIFTWNKLGFSNRHGRKNKHKNCENLINKDDILNYYKKYDFINIKHIFIEDFDNYINRLDHSLLRIYQTPFRDHSKVSTCLPIQYKYQQAVNYLSTLNNIEKYSNLIITRPDICFADYLPTLYTKSDEIYYNSRNIKCMDHFFYGNPNTIMKLLINIYNDFLKNNNEITSNNQNNRDNNELLIYHCKKNYIERIVEKKHIVEIIYF
jgi:hypothetical protein